MKFFEVSSKLVFGLVCAALLLSSCKKEEEEKEYMDGTVDYALPGYSTPGKVLELTGAGLTSPTSGLTYTWYAASFEPDTIEGPTNTFKLPTETGAYSMTLTISADGYYSTNRTKTTNIILPDIHDALVGFTAGENVFLDERDGVSYDYRRYGTTDWFVQNLNWAGAGIAYNKEEDLCLITGRLYNWTEAISACPPGWRLPTDKDWCNLANAVSQQTHTFESKWNSMAHIFCADATLNGKKIWPYHPYNLKTNDSKWNGLACGYAYDGGVTYHSIFEYGMWWANATDESSQAYYRYMYYGDDAFPCAAADKEGFYISVRCVR